MDTDPLQNRRFLQNIREQQCRRDPRRQKSPFGDKPAKYYYQDHLLDRRVRIEYQRDGGFLTTRGYFKSLQILRKKFPEIIEWEFIPYGTQQKRKQRLTPNDMNRRGRVLEWMGENKFRCDLCFSTANTFDNPLAVCELCLTAVHKNCYG